MMFREADAPACPVGQSDQAHRLLGLVDGYLEGPRYPRKFVCMTRALASSLDRTAGWRFEQVYPVGRPSNVRPCPTNSPEHRHTSGELVDGWIETPDVVRHFVCLSARLIPLIGDIPGCRFDQVYPEKEPTA